MVQMYNTPHPGEVLRDSVFVATGISVTDFAQRLGVTLAALSRVLNCRAGISADMALRLAAALGGCAQSWLLVESTDKAILDGMSRYKPHVSSNLASRLSNVPSGKWPAFRASSSTRQSEKPSEERV